MRELPEWLAKNYGMIDSDEPLPFGFSEVCWDEEGHQIDCPEQEEA
jgi:hypothetical protein